MIRTVLIALLLCGYAGAQEVLATFPEVSGSNLEEQEYTLPQDFEGELNLVLVAFTQGQQAQVDTWLSYAEELDTEGLRVYELPVLGRSYRLLRSVIDGGMRSGISDPVARARTITLYGDKPAFMEALNMPSERTIYALLVNAAGEVLWQVDGEHTREKAAGLEQILNKAKLPANYDGGL